MEKVATDIYSFARMREEGFTYVDKTEELYAMASGDAGAQFFMARPRRFGKSLAVSTLKFPNLGIESSFLSCVASAYTGKDDVASANYAFEAAKALYAHDPQKFVKALKSFFTDIPYDMTDRQNEQMWQTIVYVVLRSIGVNVNGEVKTHDGRIDMDMSQSAAHRLPSQEDYHRRQYAETVIGGTGRRFESTYPG